MTVAGLTVVGPRIAAAVLLSTALYTLVPGHLTHAEAPASTSRYAADGVYRARHPFQSTDRTGEFCFVSVSHFATGGGRGAGGRVLGAGEVEAFVCQERPTRSSLRQEQFRRMSPATASLPAISARASLSNGTGDSFVVPSCEERGRKGGKVANLPRAGAKQGKTKTARSPFKAHRATSRFSPTTYSPKKKIDLQKKRILFSSNRDNNNNTTVMLNPISNYFKEH